MLELGAEEEQGHKLVGRRAAQVADVLVTLGTRAHMYAEAALKAGMKASAVFEFTDSTGARVTMGPPETDVPPKARSR